MPPQKPANVSTDGSTQESITTDMLQDNVVTSNKQALSGSFTDETVNRVIGTTYRNTSGKLKIVYAYLVASTAGAGNKAMGTALLDTVTPAVNEIGRVGINIGVASLEEVFLLVMLVPNGDYYAVGSDVGAGGSLVLQSWIEASL